MGYCPTHDKEHIECRNKRDGVLIGFDCPLCMRMRMLANNDKIRAALLTESVASNCISYNSFGWWDHD